VNRFLSTVKKNSKSIAMVVAFLTGGVDIFDGEDFRGIVSEAVRFLRLSTQAPSNISTQGSSKRYQDVAYILSASYKFGLKSELDQVIARFSRDGSLASASILETVYLPFLVVLAKYIEKSRV